MEAGTRLAGKLQNLDVDLCEAIAACRLQLNPCGSSDASVDLGMVGSQLRRQKPDWDVRNYGVSKSQGLSGLLELPELKRLFETKKKGSAIFVKEKGIS